MLGNDEYISLSLENNLFWLRIMKEHAIFITISLLPINRQQFLRATQFKQQFDRLLLETIKLSNNSVSGRSLQSGQFFTNFTETAEQVTGQLTGIDINSNLTRMEYNIQPFEPFGFTMQKLRDVSSLNQKILNQVEAFERFKSDLYNMQSSCRIFTFLYTSVYEHILHEAQKYKEILTGLQEKNENYNKDFETFWNHHMEDHAKVMRGLFDPSEAERFNAADQFAKIFDAIVHSETAGRREELDATQALSDFKANTTKGILECKVKSLMSPLFTDHILREANYYLYLLRTE